MFDSFCLDTPIYIRLSLALGSEAMARRQPHARRRIQPRCGQHYYSKNTLFDHAMPCYVRPRAAITRGAAGGPRMPPTQQPFILNCTRNLAVRTVCMMMLARRQSECIGDLYDVILRECRQAVAQALVRQTCHSSTRMRMRVSAGKQRRGYQGEHLGTGEKIIWF